MSARLAIFFALLLAVRAEAWTRHVDVEAEGTPPERMAVYSSLTRENVARVLHRYLPHLGLYGGKAVAFVGPGGQVRVGFLGPNQHGHHSDALVAIGAERLSRLDSAQMTRVAGLQIQGASGKIEAIQWDSRITARQAREAIELDPRHVEAINRAVMDAIEPSVLSDRFAGIDVHFLEKTVNPELPLRVAWAGGVPRAHRGVEELLAALTGPQLAELMVEALRAWASGERGVEPSDFDVATGTHLARARQRTLRAARFAGEPRSGFAAELTTRLREGRLQLSQDGWRRVEAASRALSGLRAGWLPELEAQSRASAALRKAATAIVCALDPEGTGPVFRPRAVSGKPSAVVCYSDGTLDVSLDVAMESEQPLSWRLAYELSPFFGPFVSTRTQVIARAERALARVPLPLPPGGLDSWLLGANAVERGLSLTRLTLAAANDEFPSVSEDGRLVAFCRLQPPARKEIRILDLETGKGRRLETGAGAAMQPDFSPDGRHVAFRGENVLNRGKQPGTPLGDFDICVVPIDGGPVTRLTSSPAQEKHPQYSPDGRRIAYYANRDTPNHQIFVMDATGKDSRRLTGGPGDHKHPSWTPDGRRILYHANTRQGADGQPRWDIYSMSAGGSGIERLTESDQGDRHPFMSSDGRWIAFHTNAGRIHLVAPDGGLRFDLTGEATGYYRDPAWFPHQSRLLAMRVDAPGRASLYALDLLPPPGR